MSIAFGITFLLVAGLAAFTASNVLSPWFSPAVSMQVYGVSLVAALVLAVLLAAIAAGHVARLDDALRSLDLRLASLPEAMGLPRDRDASAAELDALPPSEEEIDDLLERIEAVPPESAVAEFAVTGTLVEVSTAITAARTRREVLKEIVHQRSEVFAARRRIAPSVAGPIVACVLFAAVAGPMLPGSEGFAARNFQLNTGAILFLAYGWVFLLAWTALAIGCLAAKAERRNAQPTGVEGRAA